MTSTHEPKPHLERFHGDLEQVFGQRLRSVLAYDTHLGMDTPVAARGGAGDDRSDEHVHVLVLVETLTFDDLLACAGRTAGWAKAHIDTPLLMTTGDFARSLDAFPLELGAIAAAHTLIAGEDPFEHAGVQPADVRRACETQAKSHLIHLREGFLEAQGDPTTVSRLIALSVPSFRTLLVNLARLDRVDAASREALAQYAGGRIGVAPDLVNQVLAADAGAKLDRSDAHRVYAAYLDAVERLTRFIDTWKAAE